MKDSAGKLSVHSLAHRYLILGEGEEEGENDHWGPENERIQLSFLVDRRRLWPWG